MGACGPHQGLSTGDRDLLPSSASDLQLGFGVQPLDAFVVHPMTRLPQLQIDHPGPVATVAVSEGDNAPPECQVSVRRRLIPQRRRTHAHHREARVAHSDRARSYAAPAFDELVRLPFFS